jgi:hypothetical protein
MPIALAPTDWSEVSGDVGPNEQRYAQDSKLHVQFYIRPMLQTAASEEAGRPVFADIEHIRIMIPGDKLSIIDRLASSDDKSRFAEHYSKFKAGQGDAIVGTRLEVVPWMTRSKVEEYKFFGVFTVEQLADANDSVGNKFPSFQTDKRKCREFLEATSGTNARIAELEKQIAALTAVKANPAIKKEQ